MAKLDNARIAVAPVAVMLTGQDDANVNLRALIEVVARETHARVDKASGAGALWLSLFATRL